MTYFYSINITHVMEYTYLWLYKTYLCRLERDLPAGLGEESCYVVRGPENRGLSLGSEAFSPIAIRTEFGYQPHELEEEPELQKEMQSG